MLVICSYLKLRCHWSIWSDIKQVNQSTHFLCGVCKHDIYHTSTFASRAVWFTASRLFKRTWRNSGFEWTIWEVPRCVAQCERRSSFQEDWLVMFPRKVRVKHSAGAWEQGRKLFPYLKTFSETTFHSQLPGKRRGHPETARIVLKWWNQEEIRVFRNSILWFKLQDTES